MFVLELAGQSRYCPAKRKLIEAMIPISPSPPESRRGSSWWISLLLAAGTLLVYWPVSRFQFVSFDDTDFVTANPHVQAGLTFEGFKWAWHSEVARNWHPITMLTHMLDCQLFGLNAGGHHLVNVLFHIANAVLLFQLLRLMTGAVWRSAFVAALFAWHPLHVESVAWIAERKDVLSTFFWFLTVWAYVRYVRELGAQNSKFKLYYALALLFFALGLMSKPMLVTVPFVLLLLDFWPLGRLNPVLTTATTAPQSQEAEGTSSSGGCRGEINISGPPALGKNSVPGDERGALRRHIFHSETRGRNADRTRSASRLAD